MDIIAYILRSIVEKPTCTQRDLSVEHRRSLGTINKYVQKAKKEGLIETDHENYVVTAKGLEYLKPYKVDNAVILAAGFGSRFVPMTYVTPKGLIPVFGTPMIEREIEQLHVRNITDITIVVGYLKEQFEYLIDKYGVTLIYNPEYNIKNNLASLYLALPKLKNTYILSADNWMRENIFHTYEPNSIYSGVYVTEKTDEWCMKTDGKGLINSITVGGSDSYVMCGPVYFNKDFSMKISKWITQYYNKPGTNDYLWEQILIDHGEELPIYLMPYSNNIIYEFDTLDDLRKVDASYITRSYDKVLETIARVFQVEEKEITNIYPIKKGMTNQSFVFTVYNKEYIFRLPGVGTDKLINRIEEKNVYEVTKELDFTEEMIYFDSKTGTKISNFYRDCRSLDAENIEDVKICINIMHKLHDAKLRVSHYFDIEREIIRYHKLCKETDAFFYTDYDNVLKNMEELIEIKNSLCVEPILCHCDINPDNILICENYNILIDWEYSGMGDPLMDISMFSIYSYYTKEQMDAFLEKYLGRMATKEETMRMYIYVALGGFLWSLWTNYKQALGTEFGEYGMKMYRYAKDYYKFIKELGV